MSETESKVQVFRSRFSWASLPLCFFSLCLLDAALRYVFRSAGSTRFLDWRALVFTGAWSCFWTALTALLPPLARRISMGVLGVFFSLLTLVHGVMYHIFGEFFSFSDTNFAGDGARFFSLTYFQIPLGLVGGILLALLVMALGIFLVPSHKPGKRRWPLRVGALVVAAAAIGGIFSLHNSLMPKEDTMWWGNAYDPKNEKQSYKEFTDSNRNLMMTGLYQYTVRDFLVSFGLEGDVLSLDRLDEYFETRSQETGVENQLTGALKGKNLIMVMLESIDTWLLTPEYMPNLYGLEQESVDFVHHYTPLFLSAGTFNTEFISQTGLLPAPTGLSSSAYSTNEFPLSLAHLFAQEGYEVNSFHSASPSIYSRGSVHENLGFEAYHDYTDLGMDDYMLDSQLIRGYDQIAPEGNFFSYIITYSGHGPYTEALSNISDPHLEAAEQAVAASGITGSAANMEEYTLAVAHAMETDQFVGELVDRLEEEGRLQDTVLVFYTDHYGKYMSDKEFLNQLKGVEEGDPELYRTPCFLYSQDLTAQKVDKYVSVADLVPTLVNLFSLDTDGRYYAGDDIFGEGGGVVMFPNGAWYDGETYFSDQYTGEITSELEEISAQVNEREQASFDALKSDYFAYRDVS